VKLFLYYQMQLVGKLGNLCNSYWFWLAKRLMERNARETAH